MNIANKLTVLRVILIVPFIFFLLTDFPEGIAKWIALGIFIVACLTDWLDGFIARKYKMVSNFGKFMDPLADKLLVCSALVCLTAIGRIPVWITIVIISRDFIINGFRLIAVDKGVVIAASYWGKFKTTFQMLMIGFMIGNIPMFQMITSILMWVALALTVISVIDYLYKNREVLKDETENSSDNQKEKAK